MKQEKLWSALEQQEPSPEFSTHEQALWHAHHDQWDQAHDLVQSGDDSLSFLIHGYLHHLEGDHGNGDYWYRRSGYNVTKDQNDQWNYIVEQVARK